MVLSVLHKKPEIPKFVPLAQAPDAGGLLINWIVTVAQVESELQG